MPSANWGPFCIGPKVSTTAQAILVVIDFYTEVINLNNHLTDPIHSLLCTVFRFPSVIILRAIYPNVEGAPIVFGDMIWFIHRGDTSYFYSICMARSCVHFWGPATRNVKLRVAHSPGMPGAFSPPLRVSDLDMHHGTCVTHVLWCMPGSPTIGFLWSRWWEKRSQHSQRMPNPQLYVSDTRPLYVSTISLLSIWP